MLVVEMSRNRNIFNQMKGSRSWTTDKVGGYEAIEGERVY